MRNAVARADQPDGVVVGADVVQGADDAGPAHDALVVVRDVRQSVQFLHQGDERGHAVAVPHPAPTSRLEAHRLHRASRGGPASQGLAGVRHPSHQRLDPAALQHVLHVFFLVARVQHHVRPLRGDRVGRSRMGQRQADHGAAQLAAEPPAVVLLPGQDLERLERQQRQVLVPGQVTVRQQGRDAPQLVPTLVPEVGRRAGILVGVDKLSERPGHLLAAAGERTGRALGEDRVHVRARGGQDVHHPPPHALAETVSRGPSPARPALTVMTKKGTRLVGVPFPHSPARSSCLQIFWVLDGAFGHNEARSDASRAG